MNYINKFLSTLLLTSLLTPSILASTTSNKQYISLRTLAESEGYKVIWSKELITLQNSNSPTITLDLKTPSNNIMLKNNTTYVDKEWLLSKLSSKDSTIDYSNLGKNVVQNLLQGKFQEVFDQMSATTQTQINATVLAQGWNSTMPIYGKATSFDVVKITPNNNLTEVEISLQCERTPVKISIVFDANQQIAGLQLSSYPKEIAKPIGMVEQSLVVQTGEYKLPAILTLPNAIGNFPVVVLVHGSGANDKDENISGTKVFRDIAYHLAEQGIATLRYDKRTYTYMQEVALNPSAFDYEEEVIDDALSAINLVKTLPQVNKDEVYVLGHSLGAMSVPMISTKDSGVKGYIMVAGPARNLIDVVLEQVDYLATLQGLNPIQKTAYMAQTNATANVVRTLKEDSVTPELNFMGINNRVWTDLNSYNQVATAKEMTEPLFIIQGGRDYQVTMEDFNLWKTYLSGHSNVTFKDYPNLNHLLVEGTKKSTPNEYYIPHEISKEVTIDIGNWIKKQ